MISGFRKEGVYPYDPSSVSALKHTKSNVENSSTDAEGPASEESGSGENPLLIINCHIKLVTASWMMVLSPKMIVIVSTVLAVHPLERKKFTRGNSNKVMTFTIQIIPHGFNYITWKLYQKTDTP